MLFCLFPPEKQSGQLFIYLFTGRIKFLCRGAAAEAGEARRPPGLPAENGVRRAAGEPLMCPGRRPWRTPWRSGSGATGARPAVPRIVFMSPDMIQRRFSSNSIRNIYE